MIVKHKGTEDRSTSDNEYMLLRKRIRKDQRIKVLLDKADQVQIHGKLEQELQRYFLTSMDVSTGKFQYSGVTSDFSTPRKNLGRIAEVMLNVQAYRDRVLAILFTLHTGENTLTAAKRLAESLIRERYRDDIKKLGAITVQEQFVAYCIEKLVRKRELVAMFIKRCELTLKNLDNGYYSFREVEQLHVSLVSKSEGGRYSNVRV